MTLHLIAQFSALMLLRKNILADYSPPMDVLSNIHYFLILQFNKSSKRFYWPWGLLWLHIGSACFGLCVGCLAVFL